MKEPGPYVVVTDHDCHHYVIPVLRTQDWEDFCSSDAFEDGDPDWADPVGGSPSLVMFTSYTIG